MRSILTAWIILVVFSLVVPSTRVAADGCGGILADSNGEFRFRGPRGAPEAHSSAGRTCIWILKTQSRLINFTLEKLAGSSSLILHQQHEDNLTFRPVKLSDKDVGSPVVLNGDTILIIMGDVTPSTEVSFTWDSNDLDPHGRTMTTTYYLTDPEGSITLSRTSGPRRWIWAVNSPQLFGIEVDSYLEEEEGEDGDCSNTDNDFQCYGIALFEVLGNGKLREFMRNCGSLLKIRPERLQHPLILFGFVNGTKSRDSSDYLQLSWGLYDNAIDATSRSLEASSETNETDGYNQPEELTFSKELTSGSSAEFFQHGIGCGGAVELTTNGGFSEIEYKMDENYGNLERCVWILRGVEERLHAIRLYVDFQGFQDESDGLTFYYVDEKSKNFKGIKILHSDTGKNLTFHSRQALLLFSSDASGTSRGFRLHLSTLQFGPVGNEAVISFTAPYGFYFYPERSGDYYDGDDSLAVVIQPSSSNNHPLPFSVTLSFLDIQDDWLHIYTLLPYSSSNNSTLLLHGRYTGYFPNGIENVTTTSSVEPRLLFFTSNGYLSGRGFQLLWYPSALIK